MIKGIDISSYQGSPNYDTLKANLDFIILKASEGNGFKDPQLSRNQSEARRVAKVNSSDILEIGDSNLAGQQFNTPLVNNTAIQQKDSGVTARDVAKIDSSDVLMLM
jgi:hypothetical protein